MTPEERHTRPPRRIYRFGDFTLRPAEHRLTRGQEDIPLAPKAFETLVYLVEHHGRLIKKNDLLEAVWADVIVSESALTKRIKELRQALADDIHEPRYIQTIPWLGYKFIAEAEEIIPATEEEEQEEEYTVTKVIISEEEQKTEGNGVVTAGGGAPSEEQMEVFVGREPEMKKLEEFLRQAIGGFGRVVFIAGEPGIGKTALSEEFLRRAKTEHPSLICGRGRCLQQYGTGEAYLPFLDAFGGLLCRPGRERIATALRTYAPTWCLQLPAAFGSIRTVEELQRETIGATKERMLREMGDALGALVGSSPVVMLLEDLHWADPSSLDLLGHLCQRIDKQRLLLVGTFRPEEVELSHHPLKGYKREMEAHRHCEEIALGLLSQEHLASYLEARFAPNDFPPALCTLIQRKTEGHPLFATSLIQFLTERGEIARVNEHWSLIRPLSEMDLEVPESARGMIRRKTDELAEEDRRALQYASVQGEEFNSSVVAGLLGVDELVIEERLDRLDKVHRLIQTLSEEELPDGTLATRYRFAHVLYQNHLYDALVSKRRMRLHQQAGELLVQHYQEQSPRIATQLAMHFECARDFRRAVEYLIHAGDNATELYANAQAEEHYSHALGLVEKLPAEEQTGRYVSLYQKRGTVNQALSRFDQAVGDYTQMLDQARAMSSPALEHAALNALALALHYAHRPDESGVRVREALHVAEASGNETMRAETMAFMARWHLNVGNLTEGKRFSDECISLARALSHKPALAHALNIRGLLHFFQSEYDRAEEALSEALSLSSELCNGLMMLFSFFFLGLARGNLGRMSEALTVLNEGIEMARRNRDRYFLPKLFNSCGWIHRELGNLDCAIEQDQAGVEMARLSHVLEAEINSVVNLGYDYMDKGEGEKTRLAFRQAEALLTRDEFFRWRYTLRFRAALCQHRLSEGELEQAEEGARGLLETATHYQARKYMAIAHQLLAESAIARNHLAEAATELNAALDLLQEYPTPIVAWKIYAALGRLRLQLGESGSAREAFSEAATIVRMIAANVSDDQLRATFLNSAQCKKFWPDLPKA